MSENTADYVFEGFQGPKYTQTPNEIFDKLFQPGLLTEAELRVLFYIVRRTFGWSKDSDAISLTQLTDGIVRHDGVRLDWGAGVKRPAASRAVQGLERKGIIVVERVRTAEKGDQATIYRLRMKDDPGFPKETPPVSLGNRGGFSEETPGGSAKSPAPVSQRNPQKNVQKTIKQKKNDQHLDLVNETAEPSADADVTMGSMYSPWIARTIMDYAEEFKEASTRTTSVARAHRLWQSSGMGEKAFVSLLQQAKEATRKAQGSRGGVASKMAWFLEEATKLAQLGGN